MKSIYRIAQSENLFHIEVLDFERKGIFRRKVYNWYPCDVYGQSIKYSTSVQEILKPVDRIDVAQRQIKRFDSRRIVKKPTYKYVHEDEFLVSNIDPELVQKEGLYIEKLPAFTQPLMPQ